MFSVLFDMIIEAAAASHPLENLSSTALHQVAKPTDTMIPQRSTMIDIVIAENVILKIIANVSLVPLYNITEVLINS